MKKSPCIDICDFSGPKGWCRGCGRTKLESRDWQKLKPYERTRAENELRTRLKKMKAR